MKEDGLLPPIVLAMVAGGFFGRRRLAGPKYGRRRRNAMSQSHTCRRAELGGANRAISVNLGNKSWLLFDENDGENRYLCSCVLLHRSSESRPGGVATMSNRVNSPGAHLQPVANEPNWVFGDVARENQEGASIRSFTLNNTGENDVKSLRPRPRGQLRTRGKRQINVIYSRKLTFPVYTDITYITLDYWGLRLSLASPLRTVPPPSPIVRPGSIVAAVHEEVLHHVRHPARAARNLRGGSKRERIQRGRRKVKHVRRGRHTRMHRRGRMGRMGRRRRRRPGPPRDMHPGRGFRYADDVGRAPGVPVEAVGEPVALGAVLALLARGGARLGLAAVAAAQLL